MNEYKVILEFKCNERKMVVIRDAKSACTMTYEDWCRMDKMEKGVSRKKIA